MLKFLQSNPLIILTITILLLVIVACASIPDAEPLALSDLAHISFGTTYPEIAWQIGDGDWLSGAECFSVRYSVEGNRRLVLAFDDGQHLSSAMLYESNNRITVIGSAGTIRREWPPVEIAANSQQSQ
jgi:hypothetical protein